MVLGGISSWRVIGNTQQKEVTANVLEEDTVLAGGMPVGIYMETDGALVLGMEALEDIYGKKISPAEGLVEPGDYIVEINGNSIHSRKDVTNTLKQLNAPKIEMKVKRQEKVIPLILHAVKCEDGEYKLGIWVRDNVQGLGTITYVKENSEYGALGHGIHDVDTSVLMQIQKGSLYKTSIRSILKGENGIPGSMEGMIVYNMHNRIGTIEKNTDAGIYGKLEKIDEIFPEQTPVKVAKKEEIEIGDAWIRCFNEGEIHEYKIEIIHVDPEPKERNKGIILQVTDEELLKKTGGIIQGMSGSPILQNGKIVGAVTHVLVNDPTRGYGIFIENMLEH